MAMPQTLRDARGYRSRYINALNAAIKAIAPIAGKGIRLRQTPQKITPAWAGKSSARNARSLAAQDYPRVGGEEGPVSQFPDDFAGLPPRGRGRGGRVSQSSCSSRITPAWAGKRTP